MCPQIKAGIAHVAVLITLFGSLAGFGMGVKGYLQDKPNTVVVEQLVMGGISTYHLMASIGTSNKSLSSLINSLPQPLKPIIFLSWSLAHFKARKAERLAKEAAEKESKQN